MNFRLFLLISLFSLPVFGQGLVGDVTKLANPKNATPNRSMYLSNPPPPPSTSTSTLNSDVLSTEKAVPFVTHKENYNFKSRGGGSQGGGSKGCGSRGGPGYRKANGKCASWKD